MGRISKQKNHALKPGQARDLDKPSRSRSPLPSPPWRAPRRRHRRPRWPRSTLQNWRRFCWAISCSLSCNQTHLKSFFAGCHTTGYQKMKEHTHGCPPINVAFLRGLPKLVIFLLVVLFPSKQKSRKRKCFCMFLHKMGVFLLSCYPPKINMKVHKPPFQQESHFSSGICHAHR